MQEVKITPPEGYEIDKENSTFECIKFKPKALKYLKWEELQEMDGYIVRSDSTLTRALLVKPKVIHQNVALTEKHCEAMLAMAQISQLMPYYGGEITKEEWKNESTKKYVIYRSIHTIKIDQYRKHYHYIAFHTLEQAIAFLKNNEDLLRKFYMMD